MSVGSIPTTREIQGIAIPAIKNAILAVGRSMYIHLPFIPDPTIPAAPVPVDDWGRPLATTQPVAASGGTVAIKVQGILFQVPVETKARYITIGSSGSDVAVPDWELIVLHSAIKFTSPDYFVEYGTDRYYPIGVPENIMEQDIVWRCGLLAPGKRAKNAS